MIINRDISCYVSYSNNDKEFVYDKILPILKKLNIHFWARDIRFFDHTYNSDNLIREIKNVDFMICVLNRKSTYVNFEIGMAIGSNKPIIGITDNYQETLTFRGQINFMRFSEDYRFQDEIINKIEGILDNVIGKSAFSNHPDTKIIGIQVGFSRSRIEEELKFTSNFIELIKYMTEYPSYELLETSKGSLKSLISIDLKSWAELVEKIIFILPELKKRKAERLKIDAETEKIRAETKTIDSNRNIKQAEAFLDLLEKYQKIGIKIQIDDDLLITQNSQGQLEIKKPSSPQ